MSKKEVNSKKLQESETPQVLNNSSKSYGVAHVGMQCNEEVYVELEKMKRNGEVMRNFAKALWNILKQYKQKLEDSERKVGNLKEALRKEIAKVMELNKELKELRSCSFHQCPSLEEFFSSEADAPCEYRAAGPSKPLSITDDLTNCDASLDDNPTPEIGVQLRISMPAMMPAQGDFTGLPNFGLETDSSNSNLTETANRDSSSSISFSVVDDRTICSSPKEMPAQKREDKKMETSDTAESSVSPGDINKLSHEKDKGFQEKDYRTGDKEQLTNIDAKEISSPESSTDGAHADPLFSSEQTCLTVRHVKITSNVQKALVEEKLDTPYLCQNACSSQVKYSDTVPSSWSVNKDAKTQAHQLLNHKPESFEEQKQDHEDLQGREAGPAKFSCKPGPEEMHSSPEIHPQAHDPIKEGKSVSQQLQKSDALPVKDIETSNKCQLTKNLKEEKYDSKVSEKPKRRLMPASAMLLREFTGLDMEVDKPKESRGRLNADAKGRSDGSISLFHLLRSNLQH